jgi:hypothetical protein
MGTECKERGFEFQALGGRKVVGQFNGGTISSDAGLLLLREVESRSGIIKRFASCFKDHRDQALIEHTVEEMLLQRIYAIALGYEDLNDHEQLRADPLLAVAAGKDDPTGKERSRQRDLGKPLAGKSTLNRLELYSDSPSRYHRIELKPAQVDSFFVDVFINAYSKPPKQIILDLDATDDPIHGNQEGRFFHGYYKEYCYLPLYIFCGDHLLCARLREANQDQSAGTVEELKRIVSQIRSRWSEVEIIIRADSGFCRDEILSWCEANGVKYVIGLARNKRLQGQIEREMERAKEMFAESGKASRVFKDFRYQTLDSWSKERRVVGKAEYLEKGANPRFVVSNLNIEQIEARALYEDLYCQRGEMENRIKEQQLHLFADRTSTHYLKANQLRLWLSSVAYVLINELRRVGLSETEMSQAQCQTVRLKLLKIGAQVKVSVRRVMVSLASGYPYQDLFERVYNNLQNLKTIHC